VLAATGRVPGQDRADFDYHRSAFDYPKRGLDKTSSAFARIPPLRVCPAAGKVPVRRLESAPDRITTPAASMIAGMENHASTNPQRSYSPAAARISQHYRRFRFRVAKRSDLDHRTQRVATLATRTRLPGGGCPDRGSRIPIDGECRRIDFGANLNTSESVLRLPPIMMQ
jgi:hypothetical protein